MEFLGNKGIHVGWASDGFPDIRYGFSDPDDAGSSQLFLVKPSYKLKSVADQKKAKYINIFNRGPNQGSCT